MILVNEENVNFFDSIKQSCQTQMTKNQILSSVVATLAAVGSNYGKDKTVVNTNNLFKLEVDDSWVGKCFSRDNVEIYSTPSEYNGTETLLRVYDSFDESISDFYHYLLNKRKSKNGPLKYAQIKETKNIAKAFNMLLRMNFLKDEWHMNPDQNWVLNMNQIVSDYELYKWDEEVKNGDASLKGEVYYVQSDIKMPALFSSSNLSEAKQIASENVGYGVYDKTGHEIFYPWNYCEDDPTYRVRPSWDRSDRQLIGTKVLQNAKAEAEKHEGYKVFDDNGSIVYDPWEKKEEIIITDPHVVSVKRIRPGDIIRTDSTPIYAKSSDKVPMRFESNTILYYFDNMIKDGKARVCRTNNPSLINGKDPSIIIGYVEVK